jgi:hypothetical protein
MITDYYFRKLFASLIIGFFIKPLTHPREIGSAFHRAPIAGFPPQ